MKTMLSKAAVTLLALTCLSALAELRPLPLDYRVKLTQNTGGLDIVVNASNGPAVVVGLENRSGQTAKCTASFVNYPHRPTLDETRSVTVAPGKNATLGYPAAKLGGNFSTAFVDVKCRPK